VKRATLLRNLLLSDQVEFLMGAHDGLSARIAAEAGFAGLWASGLSIAASLGVRDSNEASWTQILEVCEFMNDAVSVPILMDGDTGFGNFNNVRRLVRKLEARGIAGLCIEDKVFPKTNSFLDGEQQPLAAIDEFTGKLRAAKDSQSDPDFVVVARTEAFVTGHDLGEALRRAEAYRQAGADAIVVHSYRSSADEVESFLLEWDRRHPIILIPTKYYTADPERLAALGANMIIWANHSLRASISAMQEVVRKIHTDSTIAGVEAQIAPTEEVFRLQDTDELKEATRRYLPTSRNKVVD